MRTLHYPKTARPNNKSNNTSSSKIMEMAAWARVVETTTVCVSGREAKAWNTEVYEEDSKMRYTKAKQKNFVRLSTLLSVWFFVFEMLSSVFFSLSLSLSLFLWAELCTFQFGMCSNYKHTDTQLQCTHMRTLVWVDVELKYYIYILCYFCDTLVDENVEQYLKSALHAWTTDMHEWTWWLHKT